MKATTLFVLFFLCVDSASGQGGWSWQNSHPPGNSLYDVCFAGSSTGTAVGDFSTINRITSRGATWMSRSSGTTNSLHGASFIDAKTGAEAGSNGTILHISTGGAGNPQTSLKAGTGKRSVGWVFRTYGMIGVRRLQEVPLDSLMAADTIQNTQPDRWRLQTSPWNDSLSIVAKCIIPPKILTSESPDYIMVFYDTASAETTWRGIVVRADSSLVQIQNVQKGQLYELRGRVSEEPAGSMNSLTIFNVRSFRKITLPAKVEKTTQGEVAFKGNLWGFYDGNYPAGRVNYSTGEQFEGMLLELHDLTVASYVNDPPTAFILRDGGGNMIAVWDASGWFTLRAHRDSGSEYTLPPIGAHISSIRGVIMTWPGTENARGYCIAPVYPGDIVFGPARQGSISGSVFTDSDGDSTKKPAETASVGRHVLIKGAAELRTSTDSAGSFVFTDLDSGKYTILLENRRGWESTQPAGGSYSMSLGLDGTITGLIFGDYYFGRKISGRVFVDLNENGVKERNEKVMVGWRVILSGESAGSAFTDKRGYYIFNRLPPGQYGVRIESPQNWNQSNPIDQYSVTLQNEGDRRENLDFGLYLNAQIRIALTVQDSTSLAYRDVWFGIRPMATYGLWGTDPAASIIDSLEGEFEIPPLTIGIFDGRFADPHQELSRFGYGSWTDTRGFYSTLQTDTFLLRFSPGYFFGGDYPMNVRWSKEIIRRSFNGPVILGDSSGNVVDMKTRDSVIITDKNIHSVGIIASSPNLPARLAAGWHLVSVPFNYGDGYTRLFFPSAISRSFLYSQSGDYRIKDTLLPGVGYWLKCTYFVDSSSMDFGYRQTEDSIVVKAGWNLIGAPDKAVSAEEIESAPSDIITSAFIGYSSRYYLSDSLHPLKGYWVNTKSDGILLLHPAGVANARAASREGRDCALHTMIEKSSKIVIRDAPGNEQVLYFACAKKNETAKELVLPPPPPEGIFDARFTTNEMAAVIAPGECGSFPIRISSAEYPITVTWLVNSASLSASLSTGGNAIKLEGYGSIVVSSSQSSLTLSLRGLRELPTVFSLDQNYPNPLNPVTTIDFSIAGRAFISLKIYDLLGREVKTLASGMEDPGYRTVFWNSRNEGGNIVASGLYFYRFTVWSDRGILFTQTRKMLVLR